MGGWTNAALIMASPDEPSPISDDEILFRRIPEMWYKRDIGYLSPLAFRPNEADATGLSVGRGAFHSAEAEAAKGRAGKKYYVAVLKASDIRQAGATIVPRPLESDPAHAEIPELTYDQRKTDDAERIMHALRSSIIRVDGPFEGSAQHD